VATAADGSYRFNVMPGDYTLYEAANEVIQTPDSCPPATNDPNGFLSTTPNDQTVTVSNASVTGLDFGDVREPSLALDHTTTTQPNTLVPYPHTFKAHTDGSVSFSFSETADPNTLNWGTGLMQDVNCDAQLDEGDVNVPLNTPRALNAGDTLCLIVKVIAPANASSGATHTLNLQSDFTYGNGSTGLANSVLTRTDITRVLADTPRPTEPVGGEGKLSLQKSVWNVTRGISGEVALPGETLRYTVQYENVGNGPLNDLVINDSVPEFTTLQGTPQCGTTPTDLGTCTPSALGASLDWSFSGTLPAGDRGNVLFEVIVD